jgi:hypothetical protein
MPDNKPARLKIGDLRRFSASGRFFPSFVEEVDVPRPQFNAHKLTFSIGPAGLTNVTWDGVVVPGILVRIPGPAPDQTEGVGVVVQNCAAWFHSVRIRPH